MSDETELPGYADTDRRERVKAVFFRAVDLPPEERLAWLEESCAADPGLRQEVESLLGHHHADLVGGSPTLGSLETLVLGDLEEAAPVPKGRYHELSELGIGGSGRVTSSWDRQLRRRVARKELLHLGHRAMLVQEARLLAWLDHPGAVPVYDIEATETGIAYTMRLLVGQTLRARMDAEGPLRIGEAVRILARVSETMANAHAKGVLHLDLKPANLMLLPYGQVCVLDWGVAKFHDLDAYRAYLQAFGEGEVPSEAAYHGVAGTPSYMPAEQAHGTTLGPTTDIYAAGTLLYEMLVGRLPHVAHGAESVKAKREADVTPPREYRADIPERLEALCLRMLAPEPCDRPASFTEILSALDDLHGIGVGSVRRLAAGEVLFHEGQSGDEAYQILEGTVAITVVGPSGRTEIARRSVGDLIGEMAVVLDAPRSATVTAVEPTRVAVVTREVIARAIESANPLLARMLRSLSARLRQETDRVKRQ